MQDAGHSTNHSITHTIYQHIHKPQQHPLRNPNSTTLTTEALQADGTNTSQHLTAPKQTTVARYRHETRLCRTRTECESKTLGDCSIHIRIFATRRFMSLRYWDESVNGGNKAMMTSMFSAYKRNSMLSSTPSL